MKLAIALFPSIYKAFFDKYCLPKDKRFNMESSLSELLQYILRSNVRVKDSDEPAYVWVPDSRIHRLFQDFRRISLESRKKGWEQI